MSELRAKILFAALLLILGIAFAVQNLTMRMSMRRFTRLKNAHSKKLENHHHAQALYFMFYNYVRINQAVKMSPAMAAGIETRLWEMGDVVKLIDAREAKPNRPATYRKRA